MRLKSIKLAGFKSFVDPTTVPFPRNLCAVVGPNGCGKSNIIDAVRWVMGESSAKHLRGESMTDVIFNGSSGRKPVGQASIELVFDNADGGLKGEYAKYAEIAVRRKVTREGQSSYYLNGTKCRRRDIADIFHGTGLGPRSYAIIEQGMISRLIESKPEELRIFIEEAAGISKYKERRRETENRMRRTRENLARLEDLREELQRQLQHLHRQAQAAEKFKQLKQEERQLKAQLAALKWVELNDAKMAHEQQTGELEVAFEARMAEQRAADAEIEEQRELYHQANEAHQEVQSQYYNIGSELARAEQDLKHQQDTLRRLQQERRQAEQQLQTSEQEQQQDAEKLEQLNAQLEELTPGVEAGREAALLSAEQQNNAEQDMRAWQQAWDSFNEQAANASRAAEVQQSRIRHLEQSLSRLFQRQEKLNKEQQQLAADPEAEQILALSEKQQVQEAGIEEQHQRVDELIEQIGLKRESINQLSTELNEKRSELQRCKGTLASLEALQQAALQQDSSPQAQNWLRVNQLQHKPRLAEQLEVEAGWETAVETVLGADLQAIVIDQVKPLASVLEQFNEGQLTLMTNNPDQATATQADTLADKIHSALDLRSLVGEVFVAEDLSAAWQRLSSLKSGQSIITPEGVWLGPNWVRVKREKNAQAGMLERKQRIEQLNLEQETLEEHTEQLEADIDAQKLTLHNNEKERDMAQKELSLLNRGLAETQSQLSAKRVRAEQLKLRRESLQLELEEIASQVVQEEEEQAAARQAWQVAMEDMQVHTEKRETLVSQRDEQHSYLEGLREQARRDRDAAHQLELQMQKLNMQVQNTAQNLQRAEQQVTRLSERKTQLVVELEQAEQPIASMQERIGEQLDQRLKLEEQLNSAKRKLETIEAELKNQEEKRNQAEKQVMEVRSALEKTRMERQALDIRRNALQEQLQEQQFDLDSLVEQLPDAADPEAWQAQIEQIAGRIQRLGAINLAAIEEYDQQSERKKYLDHQYQDLERALETLENAIRKIDRETRTRFKETFDRVNNGLKELFPKVFGGGHAYLELTGDDLLNTGVAIMARPPGKRNSTIHLLSGGEKALTAIALVFSIFRLNPSPFCMLDEVDAPLDDANVGRYARLVKAMSEKVQFIYITHNKIAMEMADQLMGVTMHEPGVSRMVAVDVEEAAELAAV